MIIPYSRLEAPIAMVIFDIDGVVRDVAQSYRRAIADTVEYFTQGLFRPSMADIDQLKAEGIWNNDWKASEELILRFFETQGQERSKFGNPYNEIVDYFQGKYRGDNFSGYIKDEPLLMSGAYLESLSEHQIAWGFFSGATQGSANFVLRQRLSIESPILVAMEDAPSKPDPKGLFQSIEKILSPIPPQGSNHEQIPVFYVGDTVADMKTAQNAAQQDTQRDYFGVGVIPPHAWGNQTYGEQLRSQGAVEVFNCVEELTPMQIEQILRDRPSESFTES